MGQRRCISSKPSQRSSALDPSTPKGPNGSTPVGQVSGLPELRAGGVQSAITREQRSKGGRANRLGRPALTAEVTCFHERPFPIRTAAIPRGSRRWTPPYLAGGVLPQAASPCSP